jgi:hypothetical protein
MSGKPNPPQIAELKELLKILEHIKTASRDAMPVIEDE